MQTINPEHVKWKMNKAYHKERMEDFWQEMSLKFATDAPLAFLTISRVAITFPGSGMQVKCTD